MLMREWVGRLVRLKVELVTGGGTTFHAGRTMKVDGHYRGRLHLVDEEWCGKCGLGHRPIVRHVPKYQVDLVSEDES